jgi:hypothetical protein
MCVADRPQVIAEQIAGVLAFKPRFYMCCRLSVSPGLSSEKFVDGLLALMKCCRVASGFLEDLIRVKGIDLLQFDAGKVLITPCKGANVEELCREVLEIIERHPDQWSW